MPRMKHILKHVKRTQDYKTVTKHEHNKAVT